MEREREERGNCREKNGWLGTEEVPEAHDTTVDQAAGWRC